MVQESLPRLSVIIPTYNRRDVLQHALDSVRAQTVAVDEIIVVDDASTDGTVEFLRETQPDVVVTRMTKRSGAAAARNAGIAVAAGSYLAFLDSDDRFLPAKLEVQLHLMRAANASFSTTAFMTPDGQTRMNRPVTRPLLLKGNYLGGTSGLLADAALLRKHPFDPSMLAVQDWELFLRLSKIAPFLHVPEPLYVYETRRSDQMTKQKRRRLIGHVQLYRKHIENADVSLSVRLTHRMSHAMLLSDLKSQRSRTLINRIIYRALR